ncbi:unnamed protein product [Candidula unifasciata]|uniref:dolichyl-phosphate-mannose--protein mannosyltransferase n=1 Tax=Candidula unifasciata TaxID=100452 RepID=A0A8S3YRG6_9EUPU|nr:unnamed protein product [Candidula unifasciata]
MLIEEKLHHRVDIKTYAVFLLPCLLAAACFCNGLSGQFVHDDVFAIRNNPDVTGSSPLLQLFGNDFWVDAWMILGATDPTDHFAFDYLVSGGNPVWFHVINTVLHTIVTLTLTWVCLHVLHTSTTCAVLTSCLFAVHPIHTEAVRYCVEPFSFCVHIHMFSESVFTIAPTFFGLALTFPRLLTFLYLPTFNIWLLLCPATLSYDWGGASIPLMSSVSDLRNIVSVIFYLSLALMVWTGLQKMFNTNKCGAEGTSALSTIMAVCLMVLPFLPASNLFFRVGFVVAERVLYIPSMGYCLLVTQGFLTLRSRLPGLRSLLMLLYLLLLLALATRTLDRNQVWQSRHSLFWSGVRTLPHNDKIHYNLANLLKDEGNITEAEKHYKEAIALNPGFASYHLNLGTLLNNNSQARHHYQEALRLQPQHMGAMVNLGSLLLNEGDQSGLALIQQVLTMDPNNFEAVVTMAHALLVNDSLSQAGIYSTRAVTLKPDSAKAHLCHGIYLHNTGQTGKALKEYKAALRLEPNDSTALLNSARIFYKDGQLREAERHLEKALGLNPNCSECLTLRGSVYSQTGNHQQAILSLADAAKMAPNNTLTNLKYIQALKSSLQKVKARLVLQELIVRVPGDLHILKYAFTLAMEEGRYTEALQHIQEVISLVTSAGDNSLSGLYRDLAEVYRHMNDPVSALQAIEKAIQFNSTNVEAIIDAGSFYFLQKNFRQAESRYLQALKLEPSNGLAKLNLEKLKQVYHKSKNSKR